MTHPKQEKRSLPRFLCRELFSKSTVVFDGQVMDMIPLNFHREGIALTTHAPLSGAQTAMVTFTVDELFTLTEVPIQIIHIHEIDIGCQYGASFQQPLLSSETKQKLAAIEKLLSEQDNPADRYGLFS